MLATAEYSVSQAAEQVVALMRGALSEACSSGEISILCDCISKVSNASNCCGVSGGPV